jgi:hypothetical protein
MNSKAVIMTTLPFGTAESTSFWRRARRLDVRARLDGGRRAVKHA